MEQAENDFDRARSRVAGDLRNIVADSEELLKAAATASGDGFAAARTKFEQGLANARTALAHASQPMLASTRKSVASADKYAHDNPWTVIGIAAAAGLLAGLLAARR